VHSWEGCVLHIDKILAGNLIIRHDFRSISSTPAHIFMPEGLTFTTERTAKPAAPSSTAAGMERSGNSTPTCANWRTMFCALYSSADREVVIGGLNQDLIADASVTSWMAGCTALLTVPARGSSFRGI